jgi:hypothetical protein
MKYYFIRSFSAVPVNRLNIRPLTNINTPLFIIEIKRTNNLLPISNLITSTQVFLLLLLSESLVFSYFEFNI